MLRATGIGIVEFTIGPLAIVGVLFANNYNILPLPGVEWCLGEESLACGRLRLVKIRVPFRYV